MHCFSELLVNVPAAALKATADAESKTGTEKQHFSKSLCADRLASREKHDSYNFSLYYAAKFHHYSNMSVTSHVLCVVMQVNPQVTLWPVPSFIPIAEILICTGGAQDISSLVCSGLFNLSCTESTINQKASVCGSMFFGNLTLRLLITHFLPNSKPCKIKKIRKDIVFSLVQGKVVLYGCSQFILLLLLFPTPCLSILFA